MTKEAGDLYAKVMVDTPGLGLLDYAVPADMLVAVGDRVVVGLRTRNVVGIVAGLRAAADFAENRVRQIKAVLRDSAPMTEEWLALTRFAAGYYIRSWGEAAVPTLPVFFRRIPGVRHQNQLEKLKKLPEPAGEAGPKPALNDEQSAAVEAVSTASGYSPFLLFGVTGSGKTEVYLHIMERVLARDPEAQVLLLVPEINLTPQLEGRVRSRFPGESVVTLNSDLADMERARSWLAVHEGRARVLVGTRMSVFSSFRKLSLVIVDEEHDQSFKAGDGLRYSARDLAVWRAHRNGIPVVLGSATPSIESWVKAQSGGYRLLELHQRAVQNALLPAIELIEPPRRGSGEALSDEACAAMSRCLEAGRQVLVFLNRRGYSPVLSCPACGWVSTCRRCSTFSVFHKSSRSLVCHHCGWQTEVPEACPSCGNVDILPRGIGTERLEEEIGRRFPERKVLRIDRDSVSRKHEAEKAFAKVHRGEVDILVGTQMIAKGHDFYNVGLVVILNSDAQILSPDARAKERLFAHADAGGGPCRPPRRSGACRHSDAASRGPPFRRSGKAGLQGLCGVSRRGTQGKLVRSLCPSGTGHGAGEDARRGTLLPQRLRKVRLQHGSRGRQGLRSRAHAPRAPDGCRTRPVARRGRRQGIPEPFSLAVAGNLQCALGHRLDHRGRPGIHLVGHLPDVF